MMIIELFSHSYKRTQLNAITLQMALKIAYIWLGSKNDVSAEKNTN